MTKKDYIMIANWCANGWPIEQICEDLKRDNPLFDKERFLKAANPQEDGRREKLLHLCDLMDVVEASIEEYVNDMGDSTTQVLVSIEALGTLSDFLVNHCGEDEA